MSEKRILPLLTLILVMIFPAVAGGQVPVEVSGQKIVTGGKVYYMHHVLEGQTLYSISRAYKVTIEAITGNNVITRGVIQTDQILKIPAAAGVAAEQPKPQPQVKAQPQPQARTQLPVQEKPQPKTQAKSQLPVQEKPQPQVKAQPQAQPATQAAATTASAVKDEKATPKPEAQPQAEGNKTHKVKKGESISSIAKKYGVSEREIRNANKGLLFPMPGMYLEIPVKGDGKSEE